MKSSVYFIETDHHDSEQAISEKARIVFQKGDFAGCFKENDFTAVKVHVGESPNNTYLKSPCLKGLVEELLLLKTKPFLTDTSTLYSGRRHNAIDHSILASEHGFDVAGLGIPFIAPDGLFGTNEVAVKIDGKLNREVLIASDIVRCQSLLSIAHFTGHPVCAAGATIKTLGMGLASRKGKMRQHSTIKPTVGEECTRCGECYKHCPADAIIIDEFQAQIDQEKCIGCAECLAVCRFDAIKYDWGTESKILQRNMAEHALGAIKDKKKRTVFFNFVISVTVGCDCFNKQNMRKIIDDVGILASTDPVAVDKAAIDLVENRSGTTIAELLGNDKLDYSYQIEHAEQIWLGSTDYKLIEVG